MSPFFDALETREPSAREAALMAALPAQVRAARTTLEAVLHHLSPSRNSLEEHS